MHIRIVRRTKKILVVLSGMIKDLIIPFNITIFSLQTEDNIFPFFSIGNSMEVFCVTTTL
jgi:hypothetical protein